MARFFPLYLLAIAAVTVAVADTGQDWLMTGLGVLVLLVGGLWVALVLPNR